MHSPAVVVCLILCAAAPGSPSQGPPQRFRRHFPPVEPIRSELLESGFVIAAGRDLAPPYHIELRDEGLAVNGEVMFPAATGVGPGPWRRPWMRHGDRRGVVMARIEQTLRSGGMLIAFPEVTPRLFPSSQTLDVLTILLSDQPDHEKTARLAATVPEHVPTEQWAELVATFEPSPELPARLDEIDLEVPPDAGTAQGITMSGTSHIYFVTLGGIVLVVVGLGTLLNHRPRRAGTWRTIDPSRCGKGLVLRCTALVFVLGLFDLGCTMMAGSAGGLLELNPLGSQLMASPTWLMAFKVGTLAGSSALLIGLREYRGAQVASWWLCLVCTVLALRWATYNSIFLT